MITIEKLLDLGLHLGHSSKKMNPKMKPYVCGKKNELQLLDLIQSYWFLKRACHFLMVAASQNKTFLFVSKKKILAKKVAAVNATLSDFNQNRQGLTQSFLQKKKIFYVNQRWLGGLLTNWNTVRKCLNKLETLEKYEQSGSLERFSKKEVATWRRDFEKLQANLGGLRGMTQLPDVVILLGQVEGGEAIKECKKLNIPTVQLLDTNSDPNLADLFVPFNEDCLTGLHFVITAFLKAIQKGTTLINV